MTDLPALTRDAIAESVLAADGPVLIDVWSELCLPCLAMAPIFEALAERFCSHGTFMQLEAPKNRMACVDLRVMGLPTILHYEGGTELARLTGDFNEADLAGFVEEALDIGDLNGRTSDGLRSDRSELPPNQNSKNRK